MSDRHWHLITYDIHDPKRLRRIAKMLESYGSRVQYSVFRCRLDKPSLEKLRWELAKVLDIADNLLVIPLCDGCAAKVHDHSTGDQTSWTAPPPNFRLL